MRSCLTILMLIISVQVISQAQHVRADLLETERRVRGQAPSTRALDNYMMAYEAVGDPQLARLAILRSILSSTTARLIDTTWERVDPIGGRAAIDMRALSRDPRGRPYSAFIHLLTMTARVDSIRHIEAFLHLSGRLRSTCPHIPIGNEPIRDRLNYELTNTVRFAEWAVEWPGEWNTFRRVFQETYVSWCSAEALHPMPQLPSSHRSRMKRFMESGLYAIYYPLGIDLIRAMTTSVTSDLPDAVLLSSDPRAFVENAYEQLLDRPPTAEESNQLKAYLITFEEEVTPTMVFLAILQANE